LLDDWLLHDLLYDRIGCGRGCLRRHLKAAPRGCFLDRAGVVGIVGFVAWSDRVNVVGASVSVSVSR
jgi:hypothetical protein